MSVQGYLQTRASDAVLTAEEKDSIERSITALESKLKHYFGDGLSECFRFGSSTRGTILPRNMDEASDVDYMVVFPDHELKPQTYLTRLHAFTERHYQRSEIYQSHPTIVLEMNHIRFDLVPARKPIFFPRYMIPAPNNVSTGWVSTDPSGFLADLDKKNQRLGGLLKPVIRLMKYWNAQNGMVFPSYELEKTIANGTTLNALFGPKSLKDLFYRAVNLLSVPDSQASWRQETVRHAKALVSRTRLLERAEKAGEAEKTIQRLIPTG